MQNAEALNGKADAAPSPFFPEGALCVTTRRIVIVSPFPAQLRELVTELAARCYDVLMFHNANEPLLPLLQNDLIIVDRTWGTEEELPAEAASASEFLHLVGDRTVGSLPEGRTLAWPSPLPDALERIERLASQSKPLSQADPAAADRLRYKDVEIDLKRMTVMRAGARVDLTKTEYDLLRVLLLADGVLSRQAIMEAIWGDEYFGGSNSIDVHIRSLRQKLGDDPKLPTYIATVRGVGYRLAE